MKVLILIGCCFVLMIMILYKKKAVASPLDLRQGTTYTINNATEASNSPIAFLTGLTVSCPLSIDLHNKINSDSKLIENNLSVLTEELKLCAQFLRPNKKNASTTAKCSHIINKNNSHRELENASLENNSTMELPSLKQIGSAEKSPSPIINVKVQVKGTPIFIPTTRKPIRPPGRSNKAAVITVDFAS